MFIFFCGNQEHNVLMTARIGEKLKARAKEIDLSNAQVARRVGVSERAYYYYTNDTREPNLTTLKKIAEVLDISLDELLSVER